MKRVLIANSYIPWGGLGRYSINLAQCLKEYNYEIVGLVTHHNTECFEEYKRNVSNLIYTGDCNTISKYYSLVKKINALSPDFIVINFLATLQYILPFIRHSKIIHIIHSDQAEYYRIAKINAKYVDCWITPSPKVAEQFNIYNNNKYSEKVKVIPHGVCITENLHITSDKDTLEIIFVGALYQHKGVLILPEILKKLILSNVNFHFTVIGGGDLQDWLLAEFQNAGIMHYVSFEGVKSNLEVIDYYHLSDVLLLPTRIESFGLAIAEAMANGVVPVVSHLEGITDSIVKEGETGFLVPKDDIRLFHDRILFLNRNRELLNNMKRKAYLSAKEKFSLSAMGKAYNRVLNEIS